MIRNGYRVLEGRKKEKKCLLEINDDFYKNETE